MTDVVDKATRSRMMSGIGAKNTAPELRLRLILHRHGFRYRLHQADLPGKPDIVLKKYRTVVFVHGCFWHCHECAMFKWPASNRDFWRKKISRNRIRYEKQIVELVGMGWRVLTVWECALRGPNAQADGMVLKHFQRWIFSRLDRKELSGKMGK